MCCCSRSGDAVEDDIDVEVTAAGYSELLQAAGRVVSLEHTAAAAAAL